MAFPYEVLVGLISVGIESDFVSRGHPPLVMDTILFTDFCSLLCQSKSLHFMTTPCYQSSNAKVAHAFTHLSRNGGCVGWFDQSD